MKSNKKAQGFAAFGAIETIIMALVTASIILGLGLFALEKISIQINDTAPNSEAFLAVNSTIGEIGGISDWFGILIAVGMIAIVLAVLYLVRGTTASR